MNLIIGVAGLVLCVLGFVQAGSSRFLEKRTRRYFILIFSFLVAYVAANLAGQFTDGGSIDQISLFFESAISSVLTLLLTAFLLERSGEADWRHNRAFQIAAGLEAVYLALLVYTQFSYLPEQAKPGQTGAEQEKLVVQCFGHFEVYWRGEQVSFKRRQTKELLAYLVDREGVVCSAGEIALALWEQGSAGSAEANRIRVLISDLKSTLKEIGMDGLLIRERRHIGIRREGLDCDYYRMLEGDMDAVNACQGAYMPEYSWAELTNARLQFRRKQ